ncbi:hypothetical protein [Hymenobacter sediminicola]|uniref:Uncharacterized protein n=1 Tax=Hymenobacter sediminicola TaxID=2761579 RepID=A0A7G7W8W0_9BACT|nr:hypothetical protein [Hymenobacter sediminicola]QNH62803.1 hypothetical protein H4317_03000 [Hymenobacter sediminicola]
MNDFILRTKPWQIFLCLLVPRVASWTVEDGIIDSILSFASLFLWVAWIALLVSSLSRIRADVLGYNFTWFLTNVFVVLLALAYASFANDSEFQFSSISFQVAGIAMLPGLYAGFAYIHLHWFTASLLLAKEHGRRPDFSQAFVSFLALWFWPLGVWFVQEKANKIGDEDFWARRAVGDLGAEQVEQF